MGKAGLEVQDIIWETPTVMVVVVVVAVEVGQDVAGRDLMV